MKNTDLSKIPTSELIEKIAYHSDVDALNEILTNRALFKLDNKRYLLSEFLIRLRNKKFSQYIVVGKNIREIDEYLDDVYDRTLDKYMILKPKTKNEKTEDPYYNIHYHNVYKKITEEKEKNLPKWEYEVEARVEKTFRNHVIGQIKQSWLETLREKNKLYRRARRPISGKKVELKKPYWIEKRAFRKWLKKNINPDWSQKGEKERIQNMIYNQYGYGNIVSIEDQTDRNYALATFMEPIDYKEKVERKEYLVRTIADEKADSIEQQRPAIRNLGKEKLKQLVFKILNNITKRGYKDIEIAHEFKLTKATFSRFAGKFHKKRKIGDSPIIPDLWENIAQFVIKDPYFIQIAADLEINEIIKLIRKKKSKYHE
jgi:hypothetical protein